MTQTANDRKSTAKERKQYRRGQRQQERLLRQARRRRERFIMSGCLLGVVLVLLAGIGIWQYPHIVALFRPPVHPKPVVSHSSSFSSSCSVAPTSPVAYASTPSAGPSAPPSAATEPATLANGIQCIDLKVGSGTAAELGAVLSVQYTGWLASNDLKFISSYDRHLPNQVVLGQHQVIKGWEQGLIGIKAGGIRRLIIPPALAYGTKGDQQSHPQIPPDATLIFDVAVPKVEACPAATGTNFYSATPTPNPATPAVGPVIATGPTTIPPVSTTPVELLDGLKCVDLKVGSGPQAQDGSVISFEYTVWLLNGKKVDSSYQDKGHPFSITVGKGEAIKGVDEALRGMRAGGTRRIIIPPALGYGAKGLPPLVPPNAALILDITVVSVQ